MLIMQPNSHLNIVIHKLLCNPPHLRLRKWTREPLFSWFLHGWASLKSPQIRYTLTATFCAKLWERLKGVVVANDAGQLSTLLTLPTKKRVQFHRLSLSLSSFPLSRLLQHPMFVGSYNIEAAWQPIILQEVPASPISAVQMANCRARKLMVPFYIILIRLHTYRVQNDGVPAWTQPQQQQKEEEEEKRKRKRVEGILQGSGFKVHN